MTETDVVTLIFGIIAGLAVSMCYFAVKRARFWRRTAASYQSLIELQKNLIDGVLDLNASMLADRVEAMRQQEAEFVTHTRIGYVH